MPEAPWIRRWGAAMDPQNIKFTDNILMQEEEDDMNQEAMQDEVIDIQNDIKSGGLMNEPAPKETRKKKNAISKLAEESPYM